MMGVVVIASCVAGASCDTASSSGATHGLLVVQRQVLTVPGLDGTSPGPREIVARFRRPTNRGDLLVAGVDDGVETSGMTHAGYLFPGWHRGVATIGGQTADTGTGPYATGGLQAALFYYPDNPGGITTVRVATIPKATLDWVSVVLVEFSGAPAHLSVDTAGAETNGPTTGDYSQVSSVRTDKPTSRRDDVAFAVFNNGDNSPHGVAFENSAGWTVLGEVHDPDNNEQPILLDYREVPGRTLVTETDHYVGGYPIDNCAVVVALK